MEFEVRKEINKEVFFYINCHDVDGTSLYILFIVSEVTKS